MRDLFLLAPDLVFLNHGSFGACPREVLAEQQRWQLEMERNPVEFLGRRSAELLHQARTALAGEVGANPEHLVFVPNATTGVNVVTRSFVLAPGEEVLSTDLEYGACDAAWQQACAARGAHYRRVEIPLPFERESFVERLMAAVTPRTRLIYASHITSTTALTLPVAALCRAARERGIPTLIDGAHAPGQITLDLDAVGADFYVGNCHKWLCAPKGSGFLHARPEHHARLDAPVISWGYAEGTGGHAGFDAYLGRTLFERRLQWQGTRDLSAWLAVPAAIDFQRRHGWPAVRERCHALAREALQALTRRHGLAPIARDEDWAQMVVIPVPAQDAEALRRRLFDESGIEVPVTTHAGRTFVRISVQGYTERWEIERLLDAPALR
ncbi:aminotransferase class V-fold PLP-dependent enzyme [Rubrivivax benzoatilyticus]|uniref:Aminotransferase class V-fold PLP-dependent enzyme n=1 Tax=Rubrivivax benzoatilyticus TaxID=316997 RepID=A0ABX0HUX9_9BURK|nr:aminotransferase class V-fold PLP-dependent enzyme [Rubrivivax benzoatilyticus]EGJ10826.1 class V aminotransferase [Rubrivivax benzoatilyticus JA2 = ATCC BAA-35]NHK98116.1 aminotransferase class V-fold PLP-dependent enzyme [Rubrivivax benzoatilyticus]NHL23618.1 aminotransferase class V-fold PLP-dependent enzyme [Rubrivivax benzoatilyticus]